MRSTVEGAAGLDSAPLAPERFLEADVPSAALRAIPLPHYRGGGKK